jgi:hypothetical protein
VPSGPGGQSERPGGGPRAVSSPTYGTNPASGPRRAGSARPETEAGTGGADLTRPRIPGPLITGPQIPGSWLPGPRQEYIDAFDDDHAEKYGEDDDVDVFTPRRARRSKTAVVPGSGRCETGPEGDRAPDGDAPAAPAPAAGSGSGAGTFALMDPADPKDPQDPKNPKDSPDEDRESRRTKAGKGRAVAAIAAAAVITVLAVLVARQVVHGRNGAAAPSHSDPKPGGSLSASRSDGRPGPAERPPAPVPLTYEQQMGKTYPLDKKLTASGKFDTISGHDNAPGQGRLYRYRVDVEEGMALDGELFAQAVQKTLNDKRSWAHDGRRTFERVSSGKPDFVITLASPGTTAEWCAKSGLDTSEDNVSCDSAATDRVMINAFRWAQGAKTYGDAIHSYRQMLINHEVGHRLGYGHVVCTKNGALAPVMQQQTKFLTYDGITCRPNAWPFPEG